MGETEFTTIATQGASISTTPGFIVLGFYILSLILLSKAYSDVFRLYFTEEKFFKTKIFVCSLICPIITVMLIILLSNGDNYLLSYVSIMTLYAIPLLIIFGMNKPKTAPSNFNIKKVTLFCALGALLFSSPIIYEHYLKITSPLLNTGVAATLHKVNLNKQ